MAQSLHSRLAQSNKVCRINPCAWSAVASPMMTYLHSATRQKKTETKAETDFSRLKEPSGDAHAALFPAHRQKCGNLNHPRQTIF